MKKILLMCSMVSSVAFAQIPTNGLQAKYDFTAGALTDGSGNNNTATETASVLNVSDRFGGANNAKQFNGSSARVLAPQSLFGGTARTISLWFITDEEGVITGRWNNGATSYVPNLGIASNGILYAGFWTGNTTGQVTSTTSVADSMWHHVVLTGDANEQRIYLDNSLLGTISTGINNITLPFNAIGFGYRGNWSVGQQWFDGVIDDVRVYNRKVTASEASQLFNETKPAAADLLIADYTFDNANVADNSGRNNNATAFNLTYAQDRFGNPNQAASFNGTNSYIQLPNGILLKDSISISLWFKTSTANKIMVSYQDATMGNTATQFVPISYLRNDNILSAKLWDSNTGNGINMDTIIGTDNNWHHLVIAINNLEQDIYVDNKKVGNLPNGHTVLPAMVNNYLGGGYKSGTWPALSNGTSYFSGLMDDVKLFEIKLDSITVDSLFNLPNPNNTVGTRSNELLSTDVSIYPNPSTGIFNISVIENVKTIEIYGMNGQQLEGISIRENEINLTDYPNGIYFVRVITDNGLITKKLIKN